MPSQGASPYSTKFASGEIDHDYDPATQMRIFKKEEKETHTGPNTLPYEMSNLPTYFGEMVDNGIQACKTIETLLRSPEIKHKKALFNLKRNTEKAVIYLLQNVDTTLEKYTIGMKHADDEDDNFDELY
jgi:hypothetical protein